MPDIRTVSYLILGLVVQTTMGQCHERIKELCSCGEATKLLITLDSLERVTGLDTAIRCSVGEGLSRELVPGCWERSIDITWMVDERGGTSSTMHVVTVDDEIAVLLIERGTYLLRSSVDSALFGKMNFNYRIIYERELAVSDLFSDSVDYGRECSRFLMAPEARVKMEEMVEKEDIPGLNAWLASPVTELQMYAVEGLYSLCGRGLLLTAFQTRCIAAIGKKRGDVSTCHGCINGRQEVGELFRSIVQ